MFTAPSQCLFVRGVDGSMDLIVTNPPFGANILIDDEEVLNQYDLAAI